MKLLNQATLEFKHLCLKWIKEIMACEMNLKVNHSRYEFGRFTYPFNLDVFSYPKTNTHHFSTFRSQERLGYFNPHTFAIGINFKLSYLSPQEIKNTLRHELAHLYSHLLYGENLTSPHGEEFQKVCHQFQWGPEVASGTLKVDRLTDITSEFDGNFSLKEEEKILVKAQKLLALGSSANEHEAQSATLKAQNLLLKHSLSVHDLEHQSHSQNHIKSNNFFPQDLWQDIWGESIWSGPQKNSLAEAIATIVTHFLVFPLWSRNEKGECTLEVYGSYSAVVMAQYVSQYLSRELTQEWEKTKKRHKLKGVRAKNSFFRGVAKGYDEKLQASAQEFENQKNQSDSANCTNTPTNSPEKNLTLISFQQQLSQSVKKMLNLRSSTSYRSFSDKESLLLGKTLGKNLSIYKPLTTNNSDKIFLIREM
jgi:hypothetical protein